MTEKLLTHFMNSLKDSFLFVDTDHVIRYMNIAALKLYEKRGGAALIGQSIMDCHNEESCRMMLEIFSEMQNGLEERLISEKPGRRIFMRAVRGEEGELIGYYERYEYPELA